MQTVVESLFENYRVVDDIVAENMKFNIEANGSNYNNKVMEDESSHPSTTVMSESRAAGIVKERISDRIKVCGLPDCCFSSLSVVKPRSFS